MSKLKPSSFSFFFRSIQIYTDLLESTQYSYLQSILIVSFSFVQIICTNLHNFQIYSNIEDGTFLDVLISGSTYMDLNNLIIMDKAFFEIYKYVAYSINFGYAVTFLILLSNKRKKVKNFFFGIIFTYYIKFYSWLLLLPCTMILMTTILCPAQIMGPLEVSCVTFDSGNIAEMILSSSTLIVAVIMVLINGYFCYSSAFIKSDYLSVNSSDFFQFLNVMRIICAISFSIPNKIIFYEIFYICLHLIMSFIGIVFILVRFPFCKLFMNRLVLFWMVSYFAQCLGMLLDRLTQNHLFLNSTNVILFMPVSFFMLQIFCFLMQSRLMFDCLAKPINRKITSHELIMKTLILQNVSHSYNPYHDLNFKGLFENHIINCHIFDCFCKKNKLFDSKKNREMDFQKRYAFKQNEHLITKYMIKFWLDEGMSYITKDANLIIFYSDFLFNKFRNVHLALGNLIFAEKNVVKPSDQRQLFQLRTKIKRYIKKKNEEFCDSKLEIEIIVFLEEQLILIISLMKSYFKKIIKFWKNLENFYPNLTDLDTTLQEITNIKDELASAWVPLQPYLDSKKKLRFYYQWYCKNVLNRKLKVSEEEITMFNPNEENDDNLSMSSNMLIKNDKNDEKIIFQNDCVVMHVRGLQNGLGKIVKFNKNLEKTFEYSKEEAANSDLLRFMSPFFAKRHATYVQSFIKINKKSVLYNYKTVFGLTKSGYIFPAWLVVKQVIINSGLIDYVGMIKPIHSKQNKHDYITLNEFGVIDGLSIRLGQALSLKPEHLKKELLNILFLSPKLVFYFQYEKYMDKTAQEKRRRKTTRKIEHENDEVEIGSSNVPVPSPFFNRSSVMKKLRLNNHFIKPIKVSSKKAIDAGFNNSQREENYFSKKIKTIKNEEEHKINEKTPPIAKEMNSEMLLKQSINKRGPNSTIKAKLEINDLVGIEENPPKEEVKTESKNSLFGHSTSGTESSSDSQNTDEEEDGKKNQNHKIAFNLRVPKNIEKYLQLYENFINKKDIGKDNRIFKNSSSLRIFDRNDSRVSNDARSPGIFPNLLVKKESSKNPGSSLLIPMKSDEVSVASTASHESELHKKELKAITFIADRITKDKSFDLFRIKATISSQFYGESKDHLKVLKIFSFQRKNTEKPKEGQNIIDNSNNILNNQGNNSNKIEVDKTFEKITTLSPSFAQHPLLKKRTTSYISELESSICLDEKENTQKQSMENIPKFESNQSPSIPDDPSHSDNAEKNEDKIFLKAFQKSKNFRGENMFWKEDTLMAHESHISIFKIKWFIRILFVFVFALNLLTFFFGPFNVLAELKNKSNKIYLTKSLQINLLQGYNSILNYLMLNSNYYAEVLTGGNFESYIEDQKHDFNDLYGFLIELNQNEIFKNTIYNELELLKVDANSNNADELKNMDLLFLFFEKSRNIISASSNISLINASNSDVEFYRTYTIPQMSDFLNEIQNSLFSSVYFTVGDTENSMFYILFSEVGLFLVTFFVLLKYILQVCATYQAIIEIFTYIDNSDVRSIRNSIIDLSKVIQEVENDNMTAVSTYMNREQNIEKEDQQFKKLKKFKVGNFLWKIKKQILFYYFIFIFLTSIISIGFYFLFKNTTDDLQALLINGKKIIDVIESNSFCLLALKEKVYDPSNYKSTLYPLISKKLPEYLNLAENLILPSIPFSNFDDVSNMYLYDNPCLKFGNLTAPQIDECSSLALGKLQLGIISFNKYFYNIISDIVTENVNAKFNELNKKQVYEFDRGAFYTNQFILSILFIWSNDMVNVMDSNYGYIIIYLSFMLIANVVAFAIAENLVVKKLNQKYQHYRQIYLSHMPAEIIMKERIIRAKLVISNVLNKIK